MNKTLARQYLKDYIPPNFEIKSVHLTFEILDTMTLVTNQMALARISKGPLLLNGPSSGLVSLELCPEGSQVFTSVDPRTYSLEEGTLTWPLEANTFEVKVVTQLLPAANTSLQGLYQTGTGLCTQCEPEGFRNITFFMDRPDVMTRYSARIIADKQKYPVLLSNGNRIATKDLGGGRHQVDWQDPFPKPSYLFALVAGDYGILRSEFTTKSHRSVTLEIYCEHGNESQCEHAMTALKRAMKWDEENYGREYDLDQYLILVVDDFNGGAMENKGLNIFNSRLILADSASATDADFERVESVIAHEYFHNWTGNRITLRDWFQLSLKEGLTVFREQQYMGDLSSAALKRIDDVELLRNKQFPEDAGPNAHPVRPESCLAVDNFYTVTVYEKGAEVIRVLQQLIGVENFGLGMDHYFKTYDGQAITIEHFLKSFEFVSQRDLSAFKNWYQQSGTPRVSIHEQYDPILKQYQMILTQTCAPTPHQPTKLPFVIPIKISLFSPTTKQPLPLEKGHTETVLELSSTSLTWTYDHCEERPIPSLLRGMTAPVILDWQPEENHLEFLAVHDNDGFNQWESLQYLAIKELSNIYHQISTGLVPVIRTEYLKLYESFLEKALEKPQLTGRLLQLPSHEHFMQALPLKVDPCHLTSSMEYLEHQLAHHFNPKLWSLVNQLNAMDTPLNYSFASMGLRQLRRILWKLLGTQIQNIPLLYSAFQKAQTMNEQAGLLEAMNQIPSKERDQALNEYITQWSANSLAVNKWLTWKASFNQAETLNQVQELSASTFFKISNPNKVRALWGAFAGSCWRGFHRSDGLGYNYLALKIQELDAINPSTAARLCQVFENWYRLDPVRKNLMQKVLSGLVTNATLSKNSYEILKRSLDFEGVSTAN